MQHEQFKKMCWLAACLSVEACGSVHPPQMVTVMWWESWLMGGNWQMTNLWRKKRGGGGSRWGGNSHGSSGAFTRQLSWKVHLKVFYSKSILINSIIIWYQSDLIWNQAMADAINQKLILSSYSVHIGMSRDDDDATSPKYSHISWQQMRSQKSNLMSHIFGEPSDRQFL